MVLHAMASEITWEASKGGLATLGWRGTNPMGKKPQLAMASRRARELMQMGKLINRALDHFWKNAIILDRKKYIDT